MTVQPWFCLLTKELDPMHTYGGGGTGNEELTTEMPTLVLILKEFMKRLLSVLKLL